MRLIDADALGRRIGAVYTIAQKLWTYIRIIDDTHAAYKATYEELADAIRLTDDERELCRRLDNADA